VRALRGDHHVQFNTSLLRGPILLTFDQKYNTMDPADMPELDLGSLPLEPLPADDRILKERSLGPIVALATSAAEGKRVVLCDFGSAGAFGTFYRSWLPVRRAPLAPFSLQYPEANAALPVEDVTFTWDAAEPGFTYDLRVAKDADFKTVLLRKTGLAAPQFAWAAPPASGVKYFWQVESRHGDQRAGAVNGPRSFTLDPRVQTSLRGVVVRAALAGTPEPQEGRLLVSRDVAPAKGRDGGVQGALAFNGTTTKLVYDAPRFPLRTYTFAAWCCPQALEVDGQRWHQIVSAWCAGVNDPLRVSIRDKELVVSIEQSDGGCRLSGGRVENGKWVHVAVVKKFTELTMYVNGKKAGSAAVQASYQPGPTNVGIGCNPNYSGPEVFQGALAEVLFVREALPEEAVRKLAGVP
jgi:hypothetical protein